MADIQKIVYCHGMGPKPDPLALRMEWDEALWSPAGKPVNKVVTDMAFWADLRDYDQTLTMREQLIIDPIMDEVLKRITEQFLIDVHQYLYNEPFRNAVQKRILDALTAEPKAKIIIAHSLGTIAVFDVLFKLKKSWGSRKLTLITIGSPLGFEHIKAHQRRYHGVSKLTPPHCLNRWFNFADRLDPVNLDTTLGDDYGDDDRVTDHRVMNPDSPGNPHSITGYLQIPMVRIAVNKSLNGDYKYGRIFT